MDRFLVANTGFMPISPLELRLEWIKDAGFGGIILSDVDSRELLKNDVEAKNISDLCQRLSLKICAVTGCHLDAPNAVESLTETIQFACAFQIPVVITCPYRGFEMFESKINEKIQAGIIAAKELSSILESSRLTNGESIVLAIENRHPLFMMTYFTQFFEQILSPGIGMAYDVSYDQYDGPRTFELLETFVSHLKLMQISDRSETYVTHQLPGEGYVFFSEICRLLRQNRYEGTLAINAQIENSYIKAPLPFLTQAYRTLKNLEKQVSPPLKRV